MSASTPKTQASAQDKPKAVFGAGAAAFTAGVEIDRYVIEALIGKGGMGEVYRALDTRLRRKVALKILRPDKDRPDAVARLFREARAAAALSHPNVISIHDIGEHEGLFYIVMELVTGSPMLAFIGDERVTTSRKVRWILSVGRALARAHAAGVIHRDIKPSNVMISEDDVAKVLDFGLAKPIRRSPRRSSPEGDTSEGSVDFETVDGRVIGTLRYMAPEQLAGVEASAESDQYALGVTAYELIGGRYPGTPPMPTPPPALRSLVPGLSERGSAVIAKMMATSPGERFASLADAVLALEDTLTPSHPPSRTDAPPSLADTQKDPAAGHLPAESSSSFALRAEVHARAQKIAAHTLLSRERPKELAEVIGARGGSRDDAQRVQVVDVQKKLSGAPPTLVSNVGGSRVVAPVVIAKPTKANTALANTMPMPPHLRPPDATKPSNAKDPPAPPEPTTSDVDEQARPVAAAPSQRLTLAIVVILALALATFLGTYFGARARASHEAPSPSSS